MSYLKMVHTHTHLVIFLYSLIPIIDVLYQNNNKKPYFENMVLFSTYL